MLIHLTKIFTEMPVHHQTLSLEASGFLNSPVLVALLFPDDESATDEFGVDGLLAAHGLVLIALRQTLFGELNVGGQGADTGLLGELLGNVNGLLLQCDGEGGNDFSDGGRGGNGGVGNAAADQLGESLDEL